MGTRSRVAYQGITGRCKSIYVQYDGYLSGVGAKLYEYYNSAERANALCSAGSMSGVEREIGEKHDFNWREKLRIKMRDKGPDGLDYDTYQAAIEARPEFHWCDIYSRDRGDEDELRGDHTGIDALIERYNDDWCQYLYLWSRGVWWLYDQFPDAPPRWITLRDALLREEVNDANDPEVGDERKFKMVAAGPLPFKPTNHTGPILRDGPVVAPRPASAVIAVAPTASRDGPAVVVGRRRTIVI